MKDFFDYVSVVRDALDAYSEPGRISDKDEEKKALEMKEILNAVMTIRGLIVLLVKNVK